MGVKKAPPLGGAECLRIVSILAQDSPVSGASSSAIGKTFCALHKSQPHQEAGLRGLPIAFHSQNRLNGNAVLAWRPLLGWGAAGCLAYCYPLAAAANAGPGPLSFEIPVTANSVSIDLSCCISVVGKRSSYAFAPVGSTVEKVLLSTGLPSDLRAGIWVRLLWRCTVGWQTHFELDLHSSSRKGAVNRS